MNKNKKMMSLAVLSALAITMVPELSFAGEGNALEKALCAAVGFFTGKTGAAIATMAVIFLGVGAFFGKVTWGLALMIAAGIAAIFGAETIVEAISGSGDFCANATM